MTITLDAIKAEQEKITAMIAALEAQQARIVRFPETEIELANGEHYAGVIIGKDGAPGHHLILLPGEAENLIWSNAQAWAAETGGELPTRREQSLLFANLKEQFKPNWYWSAAQFATYDGYAWTQHFAYGNQFNYHKSYGGRARAVRRVLIIK